MCAVFEEYCLEVGNPGGELTRWVFPRLILTNTLHYLLICLCISGMLMVVPEAMHHVHLN